MSSLSPWKYQHLHHYILIINIIPIVTILTILATTPIPTNSNPQAIIQCPVDREGKSRDYSICLANRSAVLFSLKWYKQVANCQQSLTPSRPKFMGFTLSSTLPYKW